MTRRSVPYIEDNLMYKYSVYLPGKDLNKLQKIYNETGATISFLIRKAVKRFLEQGAK